MRERAAYRRVPEDEGRGRGQSVGVQPQRRSHTGQHLQSLAHQKDSRLNPDDIRRRTHAAATLHLQHTSASLLIQENADPGVRRDLERFMARVCPDGDPMFEHDYEGPDDMPAHVRTALTAVNLSIPITDGHLALGTWQGIYLWEHRHAGHRRKVTVHLIGE